MRLLLDTQIMPGFCWQHLGGGHQAPTRQIDRLLIAQLGVESTAAEAFCLLRQLMPGQARIP
jgi:hypothetical protein